MESDKAAEVNGDSARVDVRARDTAWVPEFRDMRDALVNGDKARMKKYFTFPIYSSEDEIWAVVEASPDTTVHEDSGSQLMSPFRERDFDKYCERLFSKEFVLGLSKVDVSKLISGVASDQELPGNDSVHYSFIASLDSSDHTLHFFLTTRYSLTPSKPDEQKEEGFSLLGYTFAILGGSTIRFREVGIAD